MTLFSQEKKTAAEDPEKAAKDVHEAWWKEELAQKEAEKEKKRAADAFIQLDTNQDNLYVNLSSIYTVLHWSTINYHNGIKSCASEKIPWLGIQWD